MTTATYRNPAAVEHEHSFTLQYVSHGNPNNVPLFMVNLTQYLPMVLLEIHHIGCLPGTLK